MRFTCPVLWLLEGKVCSGLLELTDDRVTLTGRRRSLSFPFASVVRTDVERRPAERLRGLPVLLAQLEHGEQVRIASLGAVASLNEIASWFGARVDGELASQLAGSGT